MATLRSNGCRIAGLTCSFPAHEVSTADLAARLGVDAGRVVAMTGIERRPIAPDTMCASDLCFDAGTRLLDALEWQRDTVDVLVFVTQTPDYFLPASACLLQDRLRLATDTACYDVNMGCSGYVYGLQIATSALLAGARRALLLVGDTSSRMVSDQDKSTCFLFGDSGTATALEHGNDDLHFVLGTDGRGHNHLIVPGGHCRSRSTPLTCTRIEVESGNYRSAQELYMNGAEVMAFALRTVPTLFERLIALSGICAEDVDLLLLHQANHFVIAQLAKKLGLSSDRVPSSVRNYGNTSCASIPVTMETCCRDYLSARRSKVAMLGFGVGWSWGGCAGSIGPLVMPGSNRVVE